MNRWRRGLVMVCSVWALAAPLAPAQMPAVKHYTAQTGLAIPVRIDDAKRAQLRALQLYVRNGPGQAWVCAESAAPSLKQFKFRAPHDGEYWFSIVAVSKAGQSFPRDVEREPPELIVVVDTKPPECDLRVLTLEDGALVLQCDIYDANPDANKTKIEYSVFPNLWKALEAEPRAPGCFRVPDPKVLAGEVRVTLGDRAGLTTNHTVKLATARPFSATDSIALLAETAKRSPAAAVAPTRAAIPSGLRTATMLPTPAKRLSPQAFAEGQIQIQHVHHPHVCLAYEVESLAAADIGKVEVWFTVDRGQTWRYAGEDRDRQSPAEFDLPGEGLFGVCFVVSNGAGYGAVPPARGDRADWWIEVDLTPPTVKLLGVRPASKQDELGTYIVSWSAADKNLSPAPISLYFSTSPNGPWQLLVKELKNQGEYAWRVPAAVRGLVFVRLEAADLAGNVAHDELTAGVQVDVVCPKVRVIGVVEPTTKQP